MLIQEPCSYICISIPNEMSFHVIELFQNLWSIFNVLMTSCSEMSNNITFFDHVFSYNKYKWQTSCESLFPDVQMPFKMCVFVPFVRPCMHQTYGVISGSHLCRNCVWPIILDAEPCTNFPGEGVLVVVTFNVTFLHLRHYEKNLYCTFFSKHSKYLTTNDCVLWCGQIVYIRPYTLNTTIAFYFMNECWYIAMFIRSRACLTTTHSNFICPWPV